VTFTPTTALQQRFTLTCSQTFEVGYPVQNRVLDSFLGGPDRWTFAKPATTQLDILKRGDITIYSGFSNLTLFVQKTYTFSVFTNRAPDNNVVVNFFASPGVQLSSSSVTLTNAAPGTTITFTATSAGTASIGMSLSGPDAYLYNKPTGVSFTILYRQVSFIRICTPGEQIQFPTLCGSSSLSTNYVLNPSNVFYTYFNLTIPVPPVNSITITPKNNNLVFNPSSVTIGPGATTATFSISTGIAGDHEIQWAWSSTGLDIAIHDLPTYQKVTQTTIGSAAVTFPTAAASQVVVSLFLVVIALLSTLLF